MTAFWGSYFEHWQFTKCTGKYVKLHLPQSGKGRTQYSISKWKKLSDGSLKKPSADFVLFNWVVGKNV